MTANSRAKLTPVPSGGHAPEPAAAAPKRGRKRRNRLQPIAWGQPDEALGRAVAESIVMRPPGQAGSNLAALFGWTATICALLLVAAIASGTILQRKASAGSDATTQSIPLEVR